MVSSPLRLEQRPLVDRELITDSVASKVHTTTKVRLNGNLTHGKTKTTPKAKKVISLDGAQLWEVTLPESHESGFQVWYITPMGIMFIFVSQKAQR